MKTIVALVVLGVLSAGCYSLEPAGGVAPEVGSGVAFDVNDVGRVALGGAMGPEIDQIEGRLVSTDGSGDFLVAVTNVRLLKGGTQVWRGEQVTIKREYVSTVYLRRYSPGRTIALSAIGVGAVVAIAGASILGSGSIDKQTPDTTGGGTARRIPLPRSIPHRILHSPFPPTTP